MNTFKKLVSNLPFNPSLIDKVSFYAKRLHKEAAVRRTGVVFLLLALAVQMFVVISPPQQTLLASPNNDLIDGGIGSAADAAGACRANRAHYGDILQYYAISCDDVSRAATIPLQSTDFNRQLYSMGRQAYGKAGETPTTINGTTYYFRYLWSWDTGGASNYQALKLTSDNGETFYILYNCGNLVHVGLPTAPPALQITKATIPGSGYPTGGATVTPGQIIGYRVYFSNTGGSAANTVFVEDPIPANTTWTGWQGTGGTTHLGVDSGAFPGHAAGTLHAWWGFGQMPAGATNYYVDYTTKVNNVPTGTSICNVAFIRSNEYPIKQSNQICMTVQAPQPPIPGHPNPPSPPPPPPSPVIPPPTVTPMCQFNPSLPQNSPACKPCANSQNIQDILSCLIYSKNATNITQHIANADGTTAQAGDKIEYTLTIKNPAKTKMPKFTIQDGMGDVMDYADITNTHGGTVDSFGNVSWPAIDIAAGQTVQRVIDVTVKNPIPQTPSPPSDPAHFDLVMSNTYGNTIVIRVPGSPIKTIAVVTTTSLPNTGPSSSLFAGVGLVIVVGYFFARSRLMAKEIDLIRQEYVTSGGI